MPPGGEGERLEMNMKEFSNVKGMCYSSIKVVITGLYSIVKGDQTVHLIFVCLTVYIVGDQ